MTILEKQIEHKIDAIAWNKMIPSSPHPPLMRQLFPEEWEQIRSEKKYLREKVSHMTEEEKQEFVSVR